MSKIIDLSLLIETGMPTCGTAWHQTVEIAQMGKLDEVGRNTSKIVLGSHSGTHMDAPAHFIEGGNAIESLDLEILCGPVKVIDFTGLNSKVVKRQDFEQISLDERILLKFGWNKMWKTSDYYKDFPYLELDAAEYLIQQGVKLIAMDTPSPDTGSAIGAIDDSPVHKLFLKNGIVIVEYLTNTELLEDNKKYEIIALPLKLSGSDGSPARVVVREM